MVQQNEELNDFIRTFIPTMKKMTHLFVRSHYLPDGLTDDLMQEAWVRIVRYFDSYQSDRGATRETFFIRHVRGVFLDFLRESDYLSRADRHLISRISREFSHQELSRAELAAQLDVTVARLEDLLTLRATNFRSIDDHIGVNNDGKSEWFDNEQSHQETPEALAALYNGLEDFFKRPFSGADPQRTLEIFIGYYFEGATLGEIASLHDISESRVSQILAGIQEKIEVALKE